MKKTLLIIACFFAISIQAQEFYEDSGSNSLGNFTENQINGNLTWQVSDLPDAANGKMAFFGNTQSENGAESALETPTLDLSQASEYALYFTALMNENSGNINELHIEISPDNGTTWHTVESYTTEITVDGSAKLTEIKLLLDQHLSATSKIRFRGINKNGFVIVLGKALLLEAFDNDAELMALTTDYFYTNNDNVNIEGIIKNRGNDPISSIELNWQMDNGSTQTQTIGGLNVQPGDTYSFTHSDAWTAQTGEHELKVWISEVNSTSNINSYNTELIQNLNVATQSTVKKPILERITSSTCAPCAAFNEFVFNDFHAQRQNEYIYIAYHVNWPGAGDPYQTIEANNRTITYYEEGGVPALYVDGIKADWSGIDLWSEATPIINDALDTALSKDAYFEITSADATITMGDKVELNLEIMPYLSGEYTIRAAVYEKETTENVGTNGETEFPNVMMKMIPNEQGTIVDFTADTAYQNTLEADMSNAFVEEWDDLEVIIFIQDDSTKSIMQAIKVADITLSTDEIDNENAISIYPNPTSSGYINVNIQEVGSMEVYDLAGRLVISNTDLNNGNNTINVKTLNQGVYIAKITTQSNKIHNQKIIIE